MLMATKYKFDMQDARREGIEEGIRQGIETGLAKGIARGVEQGKLESIKKNIDILRRLNIPDAKIFDLIKENFDIDEKVLRGLISEWH